MAEEQEKYNEIGVAGVSVSNGMVNDDFLPILNGESGRKIYREIADNDDVAGAYLSTIEFLTKGTDFEIEPSQADTTGAVEGQYSEKAQEQADFINSVLLEDDMEHTFSDFIVEAMSHTATYGYSWFEMNPKKRAGLKDDPRISSMFNDGKYGLESIALRPASTLYKWDMDSKGYVNGFWQQPPNGTTYIYSGESVNKFIPTWKSVHFKTRINKGNPEGYSLFRRAYRTWYFKKNAEEIEAIGLERDLKGVPVCRIPDSIITGTTPAAIAARQKYESIVRNLKFNDQAGLLIPSDKWKDKDGNITVHNLVDVQLMSSSGSRVVDTNQVINRLAFSLARVLLADMMMIGGSDVGSYALSDNKLLMLIKGVEGLLDGIIDEINRKVIMFILQINGMDTTLAPKLKRRNVAPENLEVLSSYVANLARGGIILGNDPELEDNLRERANLPKRQITDEFIPSNAINVTATGTDVPDMGASDV